MSTVFVGVSKFQIRRVSYGYDMIGLNWETNRIFHTYYCNDVIVCEFGPHHHLLITQRGGHWAQLKLWRAIFWTRTGDKVMVEKLLKFMRLMLHGSCEYPFKCFDEITFDRKPTLVVLCNRMWSAEGKPNSHLFMIYNICKLVLV